MKTKSSKQPKETKPGVQSKDIAPKNDVTGGADKSKKFDGVDGESQDKDHKNWSMGDSYHT